MGITNEIKMDSQDFDRLKKLDAGRLKLKKYQKKQYYKNSLKKCEDEELSCSSTSSDHKLINDNEIISPRSDEIVTDHSSDTSLEIDHFESDMNIINYSKLKSQNVALLSKIKSLESDKKMMEHDWMKKFDEVREKITQQRIYTDKVKSEVEQKLLQNQEKLYEAQKGLELSEQEKNQLESKIESYEHLHENQQAQVKELNSNLTKEKVSKTNLQKELNKATDEVNRLQFDKKTSEQVSQLFQKNSGKQVAKLENEKNLLKTQMIEMKSKCERFESLLNKNKVENVKKSFMACSR